MVMVTGQDCGQQEDGEVGLHLRLSRWWLDEVKWQKVLVFVYCRCDKFMSAEL